MIFIIVVDEETEDGIDRNKGHAAQIFFWKLFKSSALLQIEAPGARDNENTVTFRFRIRNVCDPVHRSEPASARADDVQSDCRASKNNSHELLLHGGHLS